MKKRILILLMVVAMMIPFSNVLAGFSNVHAEGAITTIKVGTVESGGKYPTLRDALDFLGQNATGEVKLLITSEIIDEVKLLGSVQVPIQIPAKLDKLYMESSELGVRRALKNSLEIHLNGVPTEFRDIGAAAEGFGDPAKKTDAYTAKGAIRGSGEHTLDSRDKIDIKMHNCSFNVLFSCNVDDALNLSSKAINFSVTLEDTYLDVFYGPSPGKENEEVDLDTIDITFKNCKIRSIYGPIQRVGNYLVPKKISVKEINVNYDNVRSYSACIGSSVSSSFTEVEIDKLNVNIKDSQIHQLKTAEAGVFADDKIPAFKIKTANCKLDNSIVNLFISGVLTYQKIGSEKNIDNLNITLKNGSEINQLIASYNTAMRGNTNIVLDDSVVVETLFGDYHEDDNKFNPLKEGETKKLSILRTGGKVKQEIQQIGGFSEIHLGKPLEYGSTEGLDGTKVYIINPDQWKNGDLVIGSGNKDATYTGNEFTQGWETSAEKPYSIEFRGEGNAKGWYLIKPVKVIFIADEKGSFGINDNGLPVNETSVEVDGGSLFSKIAVPTPKANDGYVFDKWDPAIPAGDTVVDKDVTYTASFKKKEVEKITVKFVAGENGLLEGETSVEVDKGSLFSTITLPTLKADTGYEFDKWDPALPAAETAVDEAVTYTASFKKIEGPATPSKTEEPATPGKPEGPATPSKPEEPATPGKPEGPATPSKPEGPATSGGPGPVNPAGQGPSGRLPKTGEAGNPNDFISLFAIGVLMISGVVIRKKHFNN